MTGHEWIAAGLLGSLLTFIAWMIQRSMGRQEREIKGVASDIKDHGTTLTEIKLGLRDCVTWSDLDKEIGPVRKDVKDHDRRLTVMETECRARHKE